MGLFFLAPSVLGTSNASALPVDGKCLAKEAQCGCCEAGWYYTVALHTCADTQVLLPVSLWSTACSRHPVLLIGIEMKWKDRSSLALEMQTSAYVERFF